MSTVNSSHIFLCPDKKAMARIRVESAMMVSDSMIRDFLS